MKDCACHGMATDELDSEKRRAIIKGAAAALGVSAVGVASGHPGSGDHGPEGGHDHHETDEYQMSTVGYHSLGGKGTESLSGSPNEPHYGGISELRVKGDIAAVGILSSHEPTIDRGVAILDVSAYTRADTRMEVENAEMSVISFVPNENGAASVMDVKFSDDGKYLFATKQPVALLFEALAGKPPEFRTEDDNQVSSATAGGIQAIDVSDPGNPEIVDDIQLAFGLHNCYHQRISGEDYVFGVKGPTGESAGIYVFQFDRTSGKLQQVNFWNEGNDAAQGQGDNPNDNPYAHDIAVVDDPVTGDPYAYLANWNTGARVLDVSDPQDIRELGRFQMERAHTIEPVRRTVAGKRLFVVGQENPGPDATTDDGTDENADIAGTGGHTGYYYLVDASGVEDDPSTSTDLGSASEDGAATGSGNELAKWVWRLDAEYANYTYSAHNIDVVDTEVGGERRLFVSAGHYHVGTRMLEIEYPGGPRDDDRNKDTEDGHNGFSEGGEGAGGQSTGRDGWGLTEVGWSRTHENVPEESKFGSLSAATPYHWCTVEENGIMFTSCISTGVYAMTLDDPAVPVGTRTVLNPDVELSDDGSVFTAGQTDMVTLDVSTDAPAKVRLNVPNLWDVVGGDPHTVVEVADNTLVEFDATVDGDATLSVFLEPQEAPTGTVYTLGPVAVTPDVNAASDQQVWQSVPDTEDTNLVIGQSQNL